MEFFVVFARALSSPIQPEMLGAFESEARAHAFVDQAPAPQRDGLEIHCWILNKPTSDPFWSGANITCSTNET